MYSRVINIEFDYNCSFNFFILYLLHVNEIKREYNQYELTKRGMIRYLDNINITRIYI